MLEVKSVLVMENVAAQRVAVSSTDWLDAWCPYHDGHESARREIAANAEAEQYSVAETLFVMNGVTRPTMNDDNTCDVEPLSEEQCRFVLSAPSSASQNCIRVQEREDTPSKKSAEQERNRQQRNTTSERIAVYSWRDLTRQK